MIEGSPHPYVGLALGTISMAAAALAALQTFLNSSERSSRHLTAATALSSLKKETQENLLLLFGDETEPGDAGRVDSYIRYVREKWEQITAEAPLMSARAYKTHVKRDEPKSES